MANSISHNLGALNTTRMMGQNSLRMGKSLERLSSGYRINRGADGPADLVISEQLRAQTAGLQRAVKNTQEASNVLGIAEGALNEMNEILKTMRSLALHSANSGITSPIQVAADQSELDSGLQTIDRIASTTKYSTQFLLNGSQELSYESRVAVADPMDMAILDQGMSNITQVFKREDFVLNLTYSDDLGKQEAQKAYFEASVRAEGDTQISSDGTLTADQSFTLTGDDGSRSFDFSAGSHLGEMVSSIQNTTSATGVDATLIYDADVESTRAGGTVHPGALNITGEAHGTGSVDFFVRDENGEIATTGGITSVTLGGAAAPSGSSLYAYSYSSSGDSFNAASTSNVITMQFEGFADGELPDNNTAYLKVEGGVINAYSDSAHTAFIGTSSVDGSGKYTIDIGGDKIYLGYDAITPGATALADPTDATRRWRMA